MMVYTKKELRGKYTYEELVKMADNEMDKHNHACRARDEAKCKMETAEDTPQAMAWAHLTVEYERMVWQAIDNVEALEAERRRLVD